MLWGNSKQKKHTTKPSCVWLQRAHVSREAVRFREVGRDFEFEYLSPHGPDRNHRCEHDKMPEHTEEGGDDG